jgi:hypothetical protein
VPCPAWRLAGDFQGRGSIAELLQQAGAPSEEAVVVEDGHSGGTEAKKALMAGLAEGGITRQMQAKRPRLNMLPTKPAAPVPVLDLNYLKR